HALTNYAAVLGPEQHDEAAKLFQEALAIQAQLAPTDDYQAAKVLHNKFWIGFYEIEPTPDDIAALRHPRDVLVARAGPSAQISLSMSLLLGKMLQRVEGSDAAEIEGLLHAAAEGFLPQSGRQGNALCWWAGQLRAMGRLDEALAALERCAAVQEQTGGDD